MTFIGKPTSAQRSRGAATERRQSISRFAGRGAGHRTQRRPSLRRLSLLSRGFRSEHQRHRPGRKSVPVCSFRDRESERRNRFRSDSSFKNVYARASYRFNLERDPKSRNDIQAAGPTGPRDHTYLNLGTFYMYGDSRQGFLERWRATVTTILTNREPYYRAGGDFSFNYRKFNVYGLYMFGHDKNLLPVDATGALIPLPLGSGSATPVRICTRHSRHVQRRLRTSRLPGAALGDGDHALGSSELVGRSHQWLLFATQYILLRALRLDPQPLHARRAVFDSRQHQAFVRISIPAATVCDARQPLRTPIRWP